MNSTAHTRFAALVLTAAGLGTVLTGSAAAADPTAGTHVRYAGGIGNSEPSFAWCTHNSLLPRTPDAAEAWLSACPDNATSSTRASLPPSADAAEAWVAATG